MSNNARLTRVMIMVVTSAEAESLHAAAAVTSETRFVNAERPDGDFVVAIPRENGESLRFRPRSLSRAPEALSQPQWVRFIHRQSDMCSGCSDRSYTGFEVKLVVKACKCRRRI